jgi:flagellar secretion chaperone FliS
MDRKSPNPSAANPANNYLRTKVMTATPEQLQLMLFDGAIRFGEQARKPLVEGRWDESYDLLTRVQKIVIELNSSLKPEPNPELCSRLASLYNYIYKRLLEANIHHGVEALDEALGLLKYQRETWFMLMQQLTHDRAAKAADQIDFPPPSDRMESSISLCG